MEFSAGQIAALLGGKLIGNANAMVSDVAPIEHAEARHLSFITEEKYLPYIETSKAGVLLVSDRFAEGVKTAYAKRQKLAPLNDGQAIILVENARGAMGQLLQLVSKALNPAKQGIEQPCCIADGVAVPEDAYIGAFVDIGKNVRLGKGVQIYPNVYIGDDVTIGEHTVLYAGVKVYHHCVIGAECVLHAGVTVGSDGFGFEPDAQGVNRKIPQIGNVIIEDDVEIGANTTIDRAMMGSTIIHRNVKIDNLVQVAHNVEVDKDRQALYPCRTSGSCGTYRDSRQLYLRRSDRYSRKHQEARSVYGLSGYRCRHMAQSGGAVQTKWAALKIED